MRFYPESFKLSTPSDREIAIERDFNAPRTLVFDAFTKPELVRQWLLGPDGWKMPVCQIDLRVGGAYRYVWRQISDGREMGMGGVYREIAAPVRVVATEKFDEAWYSGEAVGTLVLVEQGGITTITQTLLYQSRDARDGVLKSGMEKGVAASYDRLDFSTTVELYGLGVGRYVGNWYVRWRHLYVPGTSGNPSWSNSDRVIVRNYFAGDADNYIEATAGVGRTDEPTGFVFGPGSASHSWSASAALVKFVTPRVGFQVGVYGGYGYKGEPHGNEGAFATLYYRW